MRGSNLKTRFFSKRRQAPINTLVRVRVITLFTTEGTGWHEIYKSLKPKDRLELSSSLTELLSMDYLQPGQGVEEFPVANSLLKEIGGGYRVGDNNKDNPSYQRFLKALQKVDK